MAKKQPKKQQRRRASSNVARPQASVLPATPARTTPAPAASERPPVPGVRAGTPSKPAFGIDPAQERAYVVSDLKHIGIMAASMFALLIVLSLVLPLFTG